MSTEVNVDEVSTIQDERRINRELAQQPSLRDLVRGRHVMAITLASGRELLRFQPMPLAAELFAAEQELYGMLGGAIVSRKQNWRGTLEEIRLVLGGDEDTLVIVRSERNGHEKVWLQIFACPKGKTFFDDFHLRLWLAETSRSDQVASYQS